MQAKQKLQAERTTREEINVLLAQPHARLTGLIVLKDGFSL